MLTTQLHNQTTFLINYAFKSISHPHVSLSKAIQATTTTTIVQRVVVILLMTLRCKSRNGVYSVPPSLLHIRGLPYITSTQFLDFLTYSRPPLYTKYMHCLSANLGYFYPPPSKRTSYVKAPLPSLPNPNARTAIQSIHESCKKPALCDCHRQVRYVFTSALPPCGCLAAYVQSDSMDF